MRLAPVALAAALALPALHLASGGDAPTRPSAAVLAAETAPEVPVVLVATPEALAPEAPAVAEPDTIVLTRDKLRFSTDRLLIPVAGVAPGDLADTFTAPRSGGRTHRSIDIMAPKGTPVLAVSDGEITRKSSNRLGGLTLYLTSPDGDYRFYYAHLDGYAPGIGKGTLVQQGDTLGYVGNTGNARRTPPHLHFQMLRSGRGRGTPVNPYPLLTRSDLYQEGGRQVRG